MTLKGLFIILNSLYLDELKIQGAHLTE